MPCLLKPSSIGGFASSIRTIRITRNICNTCITFNILFPYSPLAKNTYNKASR